MNLPPTELVARVIPAAAPAPAPKSWARRLGEGLAVLAITLLLIAGLLEIGLRLFVPQIVPPIIGLFVADPATAYRLAPGARVGFRFAEGSTTFAINAQSLRDASTMPLTPAPGTTRLLNIGDSFTFGMGVNADQAFPHLLDGSTAADGTRVESINAGVFGYGPDNEAAWLRAYGWPLAPKIVLIGFFVGNDVKDVMLGMDKTTVDRDGRLVATDKSRQAMDTLTDAAAPAPGGGVKGWLEQNSHAYLFVRNLFYSLAPRQGKPQAPTIFDAAAFFLKDAPSEITAGWSKTTAILAAMHAEATARGATLVVVVIPTREQVHDSYWRELQTQFGLRVDQLERARPQRLLAEWSATAGVPVIDLLPGFQAAGQDTPLYFHTDRHWNAAGHALAAQLIREGLIRQGVFR